jgi:GxxExxY protein
MKEGTRINQVKAAATEVYRTLGPGYPDWLYGEALIREFRLKGIPFIYETADVFYKNRKVGKTFGFMVVYSCPFESWSQETLHDWNRDWVRGLCAFSGHRRGILLNYPPRGKQIDLEVISSPPYATKNNNCPKGKSYRERVLHAANEVMTHLGPYIFGVVWPDTLVKALTREFDLSKIPYAWRSLKLDYKGHILKEEKLLVVAGKYSIDYCIKSQPDEAGRICDKFTKERKERIQHYLGATGLRESHYIEFSARPHRATLYPVKGRPNQKAKHREDLIKVFGNNI